MRLGTLLGSLRRRRRPVLLGSLGRTRPVSYHWGYDRGLPVDRWYIERFLELAVMLPAGRHVFDNHVRHAASFALSALASL